MSAADERRGRTHRLLAVAAAALAIAALAAGEPSRGAAVDVERLARIVDAEEDHVTALELAAWLRDRKPGLRVVDVRGAAEFAEFHLPNAENLTLAQVARAPFRADETVVLYSEGGTHAAQGWFFLRARGLEHVYFLRGGLYEWMTQVMSPTIAADASPQARAEFARTAELSRYFGGVPRVVASSTTTNGAGEDDDPAVELPSRSGEAGDDHHHSAVLSGPSGNTGEGGPAVELAPRGGGEGDATAAVRRFRRRGC
ncbi:MAG TPA: rhodanese-like domain-containing protein [Longimicrobium sp.]|nr:rhodanese-like domain-containing protein [Longimicrobium sp.]